MFVVEAKGRLRFIEKGGVEDGLPDEVVAEFGKSGVGLVEVIESDPGV